MGISPKHWRELIVQPSLKYMDWRQNDPGRYSSPNAVELLMLTWAHETKGARYLKQGWKVVNDARGVGLGAYSMEPATFEWLQAKYPRFLDGRMVEELVWDLRLATIAARLRYAVDPEKIPSALNVEGLAKYWKSVYNGSTRDDVGWQEAATDYSDIVIGGRP